MFGKNAKNGRFLIKTSEKLSFLAKNDSFLIKPVICLP